MTSAASLPVGKIVGVSRFGRRVWVTTLGVLTAVGLWFPFAPDEPDKLPPILFGLFWYALLGAAWHRAATLFTRASYVSETELEFRSMRRTARVPLGDLRSIEMLPGSFLAITHKGGRMLLPNQTYEFDELVSDLKRRLPTLVFRGV